MRIAVAALCVLALTGSAEARYLRTGESDPCAISLPKRIVQPTVRFDVFNLTPKELLRVCGGGTPDHLDPQHTIACTFEAKPGYWPIYVSNELSMNTTACVVHYEMAHMPPNYWADPNMEKPETIEWLAQQKAKR